MTLGWGVVGIGAISDLSIAPAIGADAGSRLAAVCSRSSERAAAFARKHSAAASYGSVEELLDDSEVDIVYIASPNGLHAEQTMAALSRGKHVLVEKPLALNLADAQAMVNLAAHKDLLLGVGFHLRHKATAQAGHNAIAEGRLGDVFYAEMAIGAGKGLYPYDTWRADPALAGGGTLLHQGVHAADLAVYLCGQQIVEVNCMTDAAAAEDVFVAHCRLADGTLVNMASHSRRPGTRPDWTVFGAAGWLEDRGGTSPAPGDALDLHTDAGTERLAIAEVPAYAADVAACAHSVATHTPPNGSGTDGLNAVAVADALYRSAAERRTVPVEL
ncbi:1,5-anhydro-D-fructose reductase [soil metagenome]